MSHLRDGAGREAARRVRRRCEAAGHLLTRFRGNPQNDDPGNKLGNGYAATRRLCRRSVCLFFSPFDNDKPTETVVRWRFGQRNERTFQTFDLESPCPETLGAKQVGHELNLSGPSALAIQLQTRFRL
jgi:hypothetical protein